MTKTWYENGQLETDKYFYYGELDSTLRGWYENGSKEFVLTYKRGVLHGRSTMWDENGVKQSGNYRNGNLVDY